MRGLRGEPGWSKTFKFSPPSELTLPLSSWLFCALSSFMSWGWRGSCSTKVKDRGRQLGVASAALRGDREESRSACSCAEDDLSDSLALLDSLAELQDLLRSATRGIDMPLLCKEFDVVHVSSVMVCVTDAGDNTHSRGKGIYRRRD